jgi:predicted mannosyl-3-phosphoglycerate phosphatase (HAD superfamily)
MKKILQENRTDGFVNLYEEWIFLRSVEYSALKVADITQYKLIPNINKKTGFIFIECGFPINKLKDVLNLFKESKQNIRVYYKTWEVEEILNWTKLEKNQSELLETKKKLVMFE